MRTQMLQVEGERCGHVVLPTSHSNRRKDSGKMQMRQRGTKGDIDDVGHHAEDRDGDLSRTARRALKRVDVYPKMHREFKVQTEFGATGTFGFVFGFATSVDGAYREATHMDRSLSLSLSLAVVVWISVHARSVGGGWRRDADPVSIRV